MGIGMGCLCSIDGDLWIDSRLLQPQGKDALLLLGIKNGAAD